MNQVDRFQAMIRHPDYRNDPRHAYRMQNQHNSYIQVCCGSDMYSETWLNNYCREQVDFDEFLRIWGLHNPAVDYRNPEEIRETLVTLNSESAVESSIFTNDLRVFSASEPNRNEQDQKPNDERYMRIAVDIQRPTGELLELIGTMINWYRKDIGIEREISAPFTADPWVVWDAYQINGNNLLKVARDLFGMKGTHNIDEEATRVYRTVTRAYDEAVAMIEEVGKRRNKIATKELMDASHHRMFTMLSHRIEKTGPSAPTSVHPLP